MYSHRGFFESGGELYPGAWYQLLIALYMHQGVLVGIFSLKKAPAQATIAFLLLSVTVAYTMYCLSRFYKISHNGSLMDQLDADDRVGLIDRIPPHFPELYIHPGLAPLEDAEDLMGLPPALRESFEDKSTKKSKRSPSKKANGGKPAKSDSTPGISSW